MRNINLYEEQLQDCNSFGDVLEKAKLNYEVSLTPLYRKNSEGEHVEIKDKRGMMGQGSYYGAVGNRYVPLQNKDLFRFLDGLVDTDNLTYNRAGTTKNGSRVFVQAKIQGTKNIANDPIDFYLFFTTTHNGTGAAIAAFTPIRVECQNQISTVLANAQTKISIRHSSSNSRSILNKDLLLTDLRQKAEDIIMYVEKTKKVKLLTTKEIALQPLIASVFELNKGSVFDYDSLSTRGKNIMKDVMENIYNGVGQKEAEGTEFWLLNGISTYLENGKTYKTEEDKTNKFLFDGYVEKKLIHTRHLMPEYGLIHELA